MERRESNHTTHLYFTKLVTTKRLYRQLAKIGSYKSMYLHLIKGFYLLGKANSARINGRQSTYRTAFQFSGSGCKIWFQLFTEAAPWTEIQYRVVRYMYVLECIGKHTVSSG